MAVYSILPKTGQLNKSDIRDTLNANGGLCDNQFSSLFKSSANTNIWSFRKPIDHPNYFRVTDTEMRQENCGLIPYQIAAYTSLPSIMDGGMNGWEYKRPIGTINSPYRINDFRGYYAKAEPMIRNLNVPAEVSSQETTSVEVTAIVHLQDGKSVSLADLGGLSECYPSVYMKHKTLSNQSRNIQGQAKLSSGTFNVSIPINQLLTGEWDVYPYITTGSTHYTIPNVSSSVIKVVESGFTINVVGTRRTDGTRTIDYTITIKNTGSQVSWSNNVWKLRISGKEFSDSLDYNIGEMQGTLTSPITIGANKTTTINETIYNIGETLWNQPVLNVWVSFKSSNYVTFGTIMQMVQPM